MNVTTGIYKLSLILPGFSRLTGPIFEKELRVSSRRKRNYFLRFAYLVLLTIFVAFTWVVTMKIGGSASQIYQASRMSEAGKYITTTIVWFQFISIQFLAAVMLSTAINDEIYHRTLGLLMATPISSVQIVIGKLLSRLLQLVLLLAISLPLLSMIRVFGGVPWDYVISSLCITLTTVIFVGSVSLFFSIFNRKAYVVIIMTVLALGILFGLSPSVTVEIFGHPWSGRANASITAPLQLNPYMLLAWNTDVLINPRMAGRISVFWPFHCGLMLAASSVVLFVCVRLVR